MTNSLLAEWDNFYVITGSSAAGLTRSQHVRGSRGIGALDVHRHSQRVGYCRVERRPQAGRFALKPAYVLLRRHFRAAKS
jgi:hypothetical protein